MSDPIMEIFRAEGYRGAPGLAKKNAADPGGTTNLFGITLKTYTGWRGWTGKKLADMTPEEVAAAEIRLGEMSEAEARQVMRDVFVEPHGLGRIPNEWVKAEVLDMAWHSGPQNAIKTLQRALGVTPDGKIGTVTLAAIPILEATGRTVARIFLAERMEWIGRWAAGNMTDADKDGIPDRLEFTPGILNRLGARMRALA